MLSLTRGSTIACTSASSTYKGGSQLKLEKAAPRNADPQLDKLLVIGSSGLVGSKLSALSAEHSFEAYNTTNLRRTSLARVTRLDVTDHDSTFRLVKEIQPKVIVNTAAITNVDYCETHNEEAQRVNVEGVSNLVEAVAENNIRLVHISTDYVFDGSFGHYTEDDTPKPVNYYGQTKLDSEKIVSKLSSFAIARPSVIYGWNPPETSGAASDSAKPMNFAMFVLDRLRRNEIVRAVRDQYSSPTFADNLAEALLRLARHPDNGIFHTAGRSCLSRYELAVKLAEIFGYPTRMVQPTFSSEFKQLAERPRNSCLIVEKAEKALGMKFLTVEEGIKEMKNQT
jgi:dTDP-4-dehydrorhamnose reductase